MDAERLIAQKKAELDRLEAALVSFKRKHDSGEPFPGEKPKQRVRKTKQNIQAVK